MTPGIGDVVIEAWAPTLLRCLEDAARALLDCTGESRAGDVALVERHVPPGEDRQVLTGVLRAVLDVRRSTGRPVHDVQLSAAPDGGVRLRLRVGEPAGGRRTPRSVAPQWVSVGPTETGWRCAAVLDR